MSSEALAVGVLDRRAEQGVLGGGLADRAGVAGARAEAEPVALALEGVGRQRDALGAGALEEGLPVELGAGGVGVRRGRCDQRLGLGASLAQGRDEGGLASSAGLEALRAPSRRAPGRGRAPGRRGALLGEGGDRVGEAHRLAHVGDPVGGVGGLLGARAARR